MVRREFGLLGPVMTVMQEDDQSLKPTASNLKVILKLTYAAGPVEQEFDVVGSCLGQERLLGWLTWQRRTHMLAPFVAYHSYLAYMNFKVPSS